MGKGSKKVFYVIQAAVYKPSLAIDFIEPVF
jgi:hypothetical protein